MEVLFTLSIWNVFELKRVHMSLSLDNAALSSRTFYMAKSYILFIVIGLHCSPIGGNQ